jgi:excisionase family DNA binding protein
MMDNQNSQDGNLSCSGTRLENNVTDLTAPLWTVDDVAGYLKLQPETIRSMARRGELPAIKLGKVWRFKKSAIHDMLANMG